MYWADLTTVDFEILNRNTPVILSLGAIEQHGPHLPVDTDSLIGREFLKRLNAEIVEKVLILPQVAICSSPHHMDFPGSLTVSHETLLHYVSDVLKSVFAHGFKNVIIFNSHGGNLAIGQVILERLGYHHSDRNVFMFTWWKMLASELKNIQESGFGGVGHACEFETSLISYFAPNMLAGKAIPTPIVSPTFEWAESDMLNAPCGQYYRSMKTISGGTGVVGAPQFASKEKGEKIANLLVRKMKSMVIDIFEKAE